MKDRREIATEIAKAFIMSPDNHLRNDNDITFHAMGLSACIDSEVLASVSLSIADEIIRQDFERNVSQEDQT